MNPLKQGLKLEYPRSCIAFFIAFIHESIKTRVETCLALLLFSLLSVHLSMNPLKQGLKLDKRVSFSCSSSSIYP